jgi:nifR3 family TIM-barrel protein
VPFVVFVVSSFKGAGKAWLLNRVFIVMKSANLLPDHFRIRDVLVAPPLVLAPMAGVTDSAFRRTIKELGGCGLVVTEFISSEALTRGYRRSRDKFQFAPCERPLSMQLFGGDPERMLEAARMTQDAGADIVDINLGCPVPKVVKSGAGCHLLRDVAKLGKILERLRAVVTVPLTIKIRSGWDESSINAREVACCAEGCGVDAVTVHGRTKTSGFSGKADWSIVAQVKAGVRIPIIGNGDLRHHADAARAMRETSCDGVMIGRGVLSNPWLFRQSHQVLRGEQPQLPTPYERWQVFLRYVELARETLPDRVVLDRLKKFSSYFAHEMPGSARLRNDIQHSYRLEQLLERMSSFFQTLSGG